MSTRHAMKIVGHIIHVYTYIKQSVMYYVHSVDIIATHSINGRPGEIGRARGEVRGAIALSQNDAVQVSPDLYACRHVLTIGRSSVRYLAYIFSALDRLDAMLGMMWGWGYWDWGLRLYSLVQKYIPSVSDQAASLINRLKLRKIAITTHTNTSPMLLSRDA